ncbi:MAG: acyltransferase [Alphaproteobacteria bacterium]|nr:MAG: acyltransferase [Alphaproteobacteria bacterium]
MAGMLQGPGLFRLILAMAVVVEHLSRLQIGSPAVMVFFALSGYWVGRMYDQHYRHAPWPLLTFWTARLLRIWLPFAVAGLLAVLAARLLVGGGDRVPWIALPLLGVATHGRDPIGIAWSLDIEMQFYLLLPALWLALRHLPPAALAAGLAALTVLGWALDFGAGLRLAIAYLPLFLAGMAIHQLGLRASGRMAALSAGAFVLAGVIAWAVPALHPFVIWGSGDFALDRLFAMGWALILLPFVAWNVRQDSPAIDRHLGNLSYALYLVHYPAIQIGRQLLGRDFTDPEKLAFLLLLAPLGAILFYLAVDRPAEALRRMVLAAVSAPRPRPLAATGTDRSR